MQIKKYFLKAILLAGDAFLMYCALFFAFGLKYKNIFDQSSGVLLKFLFLYLFWILILYVLDLYDLQSFKKTKDFFVSLGAFSVMAFFVSVVYFYFLFPTSSNPKLILVFNVLIFDFLLFFWRFIFDHILKIEKLKERVVIIGENLKLEGLLPELDKIYSVAGRFGSQNLNFDEIKKTIVGQKIKTVIFAFSKGEGKDLEREIILDFPFLNYFYFADIYELVFEKECLDELDESWFIEKVKKEKGAGQTLKRVFDIMFSLIGLLVFVVFFLPICFFIKLNSKGPIIFKQKRVGKDGKIFTIYKFRTMHEKNEEGGELWREKNKDNITSVVGKFLRATHLDELPQAWNVLKGDISFVGPRAEWVEIAKVLEKQIPFYKYRYITKPGLFGWAQINYKASQSVEEAKEKFEYDLYYIKNKSIILDLEIILKSAKLFL